MNHKVIVEKPFKENERKKTQRKIAILTLSVWETYF